MRDSLYHCHGRLPKIVSVPIADVLEGGSQRPMLCHIVTGLRHLLFRRASMRVSQASVAKMLQSPPVNAPMDLEQQAVREAALIEGETSRWPCVAFPEDVI